MDKDDFDVFVHQYMVTALWSTNDESTPEGGEPMDANYTVDDIDSETVEKMKADCRKFLEANAEDIDGRYEDGGHDFWLSRNNHGAGYWDGDWPEVAGERLTDAAHKFGEVNLYVGDDGKIHQM